MDRRGHFINRLTMSKWAFMPPPLSFPLTHTRIFWWKQNTGCLSLYVYLLHGMSGLLSLSISCRIKHYIIAAIFIWQELKCRIFLKKLSTWTFSIPPPFLTWTILDIWLPPSLPLIVQVVIEWPLAGPSALRAHTCVAQLAGELLSLKNDI